VLYKQCILAFEGEMLNGDLIQVKRRLFKSAKSTFGLIKHWYLVNRSLRFVFMIIECKEFYF